MKNNRTVGAGFLVLIVFVLSSVVRFVPTESITKDVDPYLTAALLQLVVYAVPSLIYTRIGFAERTGALRLRLPRVRHLVFMASALLCIVLGSTLINYGMHAIFTDAYVSPSRSAFVPSGATGGGLYAVIAFAVIPALCEEFLFRSIVCAQFECAGVGTAAFFSVALFAMSHFSFVRLPVYIFSGAALVFVFYVTRSVFASMTVHAAANTVALFLEEIVYKVVNRQGIVIFIFLTAALFLLFTAIALREAERRYRQYAKNGEKAEYRLPKKERVGLFEAALCPPVIACAVYYVVMSAAL